MGIELYLYSMENRAQQKWRPRLRAAEKRLEEARNPQEANGIRKEIRKIHGKFDVGYESEGLFSSFFPSMGLSWENDVGLENRYLPMKKMRRLLRMLQRRPINSAYLRQDRIDFLKLIQCRDLNDLNQCRPRVDISDVKRKYDKKRKRLMTMLQTAVANREPLFVECKRT